MHTSVIASVETVRLRIPFSEVPPPPEGVGVRSTTYETLLVRVATMDGIVGWGEAWSLSMADATEAAIKNVVAPLCIGRDAAAISPWSRMVKQTVGNAKAGPLTYALSAIDIALWDILGKTADMPIHRLIGGTLRDVLPTYASLVRYGEPERVAEKSAEAVSRGYRHLKLHEVSDAAVAAAREAVGSEVSVRLDPAWAWTPPQAVDMARRLSQYDLVWIEEPVWPPEDILGLSRVAREGGVPLAAGENALSVHDSHDLIATGGVTYIQPSVIKIGGITESLKIRTLAEALGAAYCPHSYYLGPGLLASLHLATSAQEDVVIERPYYDLESDLFGGAFNPIAGNIPVPSTPGLGCDPAPEVIRDYRIV